MKFKYSIHMFSLGALALATVGAGSPGCGGSGESNGGGIAGQVTANAAKTQSSAAKLEIVPEGGSVGVTSADFGEVDTGKSTLKTFVLRNQGGRAAFGISGSGLANEFSFDNTGFPGNGGDCGKDLQPGASCRFQIRFSPGRAAASSQDAEIQYDSGEASGQRAQLKVAGAGRAVIAAEPSSPASSNASSTASAPSSSSASSSSASAANSSSGANTQRPAGACGAGSSTIATTTSPSNSSSIGVSWSASGFAYAQSVSFAAAKTFDSITLRMASGSQTGKPDSVTVAIQRDAGGVPSGVDLAATTLSPSLLYYGLNDFQDVTFSFSGGFQAEANQTYWFMVKSTGAANLKMRGNGAADNYADGKALYTLDYGQSWSSSAAFYDAVFTLAGCDR